MAPLPAVIDIGSSFRPRFDVEGVNFCRLNISSAPRVRLNVSSPPGVRLNISSPPRVRLNVSSSSRSRFDVDVYILWLHIGSPPGPRLHINPATGPGIDVGGATHFWLDISSPARARLRIVPATSTACPGTPCPDVYSWDVCPAGCPTWKESTASEEGWIYRSASSRDIC